MILTCFTALSSVKVRTYADKTAAAVVTFPSIHTRIIPAVIHVRLSLLRGTGSGSPRNMCGEFRARWTGDSSGYFRARWRGSGSGGFRARGAGRSSGNLWASDVGCWSFGWTNFLRGNFQFMLTILSIIASNTLAHVGANQIITRGIVFAGREST